MTPFAQNVETARLAHNLRSKLGHAAKPLSPEFLAYRNAKARCTNPKTPTYKNYGGRGITFEFKSFEQFFTELGPRPQGLTLDRIDNNQGYRPGNVKWSTYTEQANNRRNRYDYV